MKNKKAKYFIGLSLLGVVLSSVSITSAWFIVNSKVTVQPSQNVQIVTKGNDLLVANYGTNTWGAILDRSASDVLSTTDISGNGEHLYFPKKLNRSDNKPIMDSFMEVTSTGQFDSTYYVDYKISFKTSFKMDVYLEEQSTISPMEKIDGNIATMARKSSNGSFSADGIAGAVRVAFLELNSDNTTTLKNVWVPNDKYQLYYDDASNARFILNGERESSYKYVEYDEALGYQIKTYTADDIAAGKITIGGEGQLAKLDDATGEVTINNAAPLLSFRDSTTETIKSMVIRIWIEGTDREADKALAGGRFNYNFQFVGVLKETNPNTIVELNKPYVYNDTAKTVYTVETHEESYNTSGAFQYYNSINTFREYGLSLDVTMETPVIHLHDQYGRRVTTWTKYTGTGDSTDYVEGTATYTSILEWLPDYYVIYQKNDKKLYKLGDTQPLKDGEIEYSTNGIDWYEYNATALDSEYDLTLTTIFVRFNETRYVRASERQIIRVNQKDGAHLFGVI